MAKLEEGHEVSVLGAGIEEITMSLDKNGFGIKEGDIVTIHCKVITSYPGHEDYNNVVLETVEEHFPSNEYTKIILNSKQVQKV